MKIKIKLYCPLSKDKDKEKWQKTQGNRIISAIQISMPRKAKYKQ
jgi:hypothetical protein